MKNNIAKTILNEYSKNYIENVKKLKNYKKLMLQENQFLSCLSEKQKTKYNKLVNTLIIYLYEKDEQIINIVLEYLSDNY